MIITFLIIIQEQMSNVVLAKYFDRAKAAYETSAFTEGIYPEIEEKII